MKLRAFQIHPEFKIRKAPLERLWMDNTPDSYAYRCLPLNIANQHGWEILSPVSFKAYWDGGDGSESVHIISDAGADKRPDSAFGNGIMTFPVPYLFRTGPGVQMFATGPVNSHKDGIQPLSGIIETDWSPYTFTMNYKFTRPNHVVSFEAGEPYIALFPIRLDLIEEMEPEIIPIQANQNLCKMFEAWRENRQSFYDTARTDRDSDEFKQSWQKTYFRGNNPDGTPAGVKHRTKMKLRDYQYIDPETITNLDEIDPPMSVSKTDDAD